VHGVGTKTTVIVNNKHLNVGSRTVRSVVIDWSHIKSPWVTVVCRYNKSAPSCYCTAFTYIWK